MILNPKYSTFCILLSLMIIFDICHAQRIIDLFGSSSFGVLAATKENQFRFNRTFGIDGSFNLKQNYLLDVQVAKGFRLHLQGRFETTYYNEAMTNND